MTFHLVTLRRTLAVGLVLSTFAGVAQQIADPADLTGEHVKAQPLADTLALNHGAAALQQLLLKLRSRASLMMIVAHPDDEDGGLLTYESRGQGARVAMLTLTRGEGGQNLMSADFNDALGLIRTQELLGADRYFGAGQMFGTEVDFGFSKTKEETLEKWTHERVLYDAVRAVRLYRPLVLTSVFVGGPTDGHGHHQVAGEIAQEVFLAAADPKVFPEMIAEGLLPWTPLKVYARVPFSRVTPQGMFDYATGKTIPTRFVNYVTGQVTNVEPVATVQIHEGEKSSAAAMDGDSYVQFARKGLALQKTQIGAGVRLAQPGVFDVGYTLMASRVGCVVDAAGTSAGWAEQAKGCTQSQHPASEPSLFTGIDTTLPGMAGLLTDAPASVRMTLGEIDREVAEAQRMFDPGHTERSAPPLREALRTLDSLLLEVEAFSLKREEKFNLLHELRIKRVQMNDALVLALGLTLDATMDGPSGAAAPRMLETTSRSSYVRVRIKNHGTEALTLRRLGRVGNEAAELPPAARMLPAGGEKSVEVNEDELGERAATRPYFSRPDIEQPFYDVANPLLRNAPETPAPLVAAGTVLYGGVQVELRAVVPDPYAAKDAAPAQPAVIVPPVSIAIAPRTGIVPVSGHELSVSTLTRGDAGPMGAAMLKAPAGWQVSAAKPSSSGEAHMETFTVRPGKLIANKVYTLTGVARAGGHEYTESYRPVGYPGLTYTNFYTPATYRATAVDVMTAPGLKVGYLPGTGDAVPDFLPNLGVTPVLLTPGDVTAEGLAKFDAVIVGVRAYAAQSALGGKGSQPLLEYARGGGVVILEYMTAKFGDAEAPYPIAVPGDSAHNVVVEADPVQLLKPESPLLTWPNRITAADFDGWVEERGHGFAATWSAEYTPLLETHDPEQDPQKGGLLLSPVGKGAYIYCAFALYRELPEGVPGAYRLLANLVSYAKNPKR